MACAALPSEFNLSPLFRQRLNEQGEVLEVDVLWPFFHYQTTPQGGGDFRFRPFYRHVTEPIEGQPTAEETSLHQFLWPLGRLYSKQGERNDRLFPLWWRGQRLGPDGAKDVDWYFLFPFFWGGNHSEDESENYLGLFPLYLKAGNFLTYKEFFTALWPLYLRVEKENKVGHVFLWPLLGYGYGTETDSDSAYWHRVLPFYNVYVDPGHFQRYALLWPFFSWSKENLDSDDPISGFHFWPFYGQQTSQSVDAWSILWPFFQKKSIADRSYKLDILWPIYRYQTETSASEDLKKWWLWPLVSRTVGTRQRAWSVLWPLIWWREYDDPDGTQSQQWILPFYRHVHRAWKDGGEDDFHKLWPLWHRESNRDNTAHWAFPSPWLYRHSNAEGVHELYGWLWTLAEGRQRQEEDDAFDLWAHLYTSRTRGERHQSSVPLLYSYESDETTSTFRLFNLIPITFGSGSSEDTDQP